MNLGILTAGAVQQLSAEDAGRPALSLEDSETWTYRELHERTNRYANALLALGLRRGDRVGILLYNSLEYVALYLATTRLGGIAVRLNFRLTSEELEYAISDSGTSILCMHDELAQKIESVRDRLAVREYISFPYEAEHPVWARESAVLEGGSSGEPPCPLPIETDPAMLMYTSGTTGRPKGALWTHGNTLWIGAMQIMRWGYTRETVAMTVGPLYHVGGFEDLLVPALMAGGHAVMTRSRSFDTERVLRVFDRHEVTETLLYPYMIYEFLQSPARSERDLSALRRIVTGGATIMAWAVEQMRAEFPNVGLVQTYGLTEGGAISTSSEPIDADLHPEAVGRPLPLTEIRIVGEGGVDAPLGGVGEVWVRSPAVAREYWGKPEETAVTFEDGWCKTGDLGSVSAAGRLVITGRKKDMIKSGGENIYPAELEAVLTEHPAIAEVAVIGVADPKFIETVCAVVVLKKGATITESEVIDHCRERLAGYKKPRYAIIVDQLPRTASGKIMKYVLREQFAYLGESASDHGAS